MRTRLVVDLVATLAWPIAILTLASDADTLGPRWGPAVAMLGPLAHAVWRRVAEGRTSALSVLVIVSIGLNAVAGFLPLDAVWFAVKEALLPVVFAALFAASTLRGPGLLAELVHELVDAGRLAAALAERGTTAVYAARLRRGTLGFAAVTALSGVLGGALALVLVRSPTGSAGFTAELAQYTGWSWVVVNVPVIVASTLVLRGVFTAIEDTTGARIEELTKA